MPTYFDIILEAVHALSKTPKGRAGSSQPAITKWCLEHHPTMSNMGKYKTTLRKALEDRALVKVGALYALSHEARKYMLSIEAAARQAQAPAAPPVASAAVAAKSEGVSD